MTSKAPKRKASKENAEWFNSELKTIVPEKKRRRQEEKDSDDELGKNSGFVPIRNNKKNSKVISAAPIEEEELGVVYIGHLPFGFEEFQIQDFCKQFGEVKRSFVARSPKTGNSQGHAFVEFVHPEVAQIVADTMNDYLMFKKKLVCRVVPALAARKIKWPAAGPTPEKSLFDLQRKAANYYNYKNKETPVEKLLDKEEKKREKLKKLGINYEFDGYAALVNKLKQTTPTTEQAPPQKTAEEKEKRKRQEEEVWEQRKQTKAVADETQQQKKQKLNKEKLTQKIQEKEAAKQSKKADKTESAGKANGEKASVAKANGDAKKVTKVNTEKTNGEGESKKGEKNNKAGKESTDKQNKPTTVTTASTSTEKEVKGNGNKISSAEKLSASADKPKATKKTSVVKKKSK